MGLIRDIDRLRPDVAEAARRAIAKLKTGTYFISETLRTPEVHAAYYAKGREPEYIVSALYKKAGLSAPDNYVIITNAKTSAHQSGRAIDVIPLNGNVLVWNVTEKNKRQWEEIRTAFESEGFVSGSRWKDFADWPHYETS